LGGAGCKEKAGMTRGLVCLVVGLWWTVGWAAEAVEEGFDPLGRATPRGAVEGYLNAVEAGDFALAAEYLDLRNVPESIKRYSPEAIAEGLSIVLQRSGWIDLQEVSDDPDGAEMDGLPSYRDLLEELPTSGKPVRVLLQRVPGPNGSRIWKFSNATMAEMQTLYDEYRYSPYVEWLWENVPDVRFLNVELFKWVATFSAMLASAPIVLVLLWWLSRVVMPPSRPLHTNVRRFLLGPVTTFVVVIIGNETIRAIGTGLAAQELHRGYTVITAATVWLIWQSINLVRDIYGHHLELQGRQASIALLRPLATAVKIVAVLLGVLVWLDNLDYQITAVLTGLGIGGIAVALVLQKPLEDVFGAITLYTQQPIRIGDFGRFGNVTGTVEEISLRTTRIRTLDNSVVAVPNMRLASEPIENLSARRKFLFQPVLRLRSDTAPGKIHAILDKVRQLLAEHGDVFDEGARVRFTSIGTVSHDVAVFAYINAPDWVTYLEIAEDLNFKILDVLDQVGAELARPLDDVIEVGTG
jgi:MscS family membrane protein